MGWAPSLSQAAGSSHPLYVSWLTGSLTKSHLSKYADGHDVELFFTSVVGVFFWHSWTLWLYSPSVPHGQPSLFLSPSVFLLAIHCVATRLARPLVRFLFLLCQRVKSHLAVSLEVESLLRVLGSCAVQTARAVSRRPALTPAAGVRVTQLGSSRIHGHRRTQKLFLTFAR